jgi:hypothetical protein
MCPRGESHLTYMASIVLAADLALPGAAMPNADIGYDNLAACARKKLSGTD